MEAAAVVEVHLQPVTQSSPERRSARRTLLLVAPVGLVVALLTWRVADAGLGWLVADAVLLAAVAAGVGQGPARPSALGLGLPSLLLPAATAWYASGWALATALPASVVTLLLFALVTARRIEAGALSDVGTA